MGKESLPELPVEIWLNIFGFFNKKDQEKMSAVSKYFQQLTKDKTLNNLPYPTLDYRISLPKNNKAFKVNTCFNQVINTGLIAVLSNRHFVTASNNGSLRIWDIDQTTPLKIVNNNAHKKNKTIYKLIAVSTTQFIACENEGAVSLWDIRQNKPAIKFKCHVKTKILEAVLKGHTLITGDSENTLYVWDILTGRCLHTLKEHAQYISFTAIETFPNNVIISISYNLGSITENANDVMIKLWDLTPSSLTPLTILAGHTQRITAFCKLNDTTLVTASEDATLRVWDIRKKICLKVVRLPNEFQVSYCLTLLSSGVVACGILPLNCEEAPIYLYDMCRDNPLIKQLSGHKFGILGITSIINLQHGYFASADVSGYIKLWKVGTGECIQSLATSSLTPILAGLPNGNLMSVDFDENIINLWTFPEIEMNVNQIPAPKP